MTEGTNPGAGAAFEQVDPKLNVFALANGMDLVKSDHDRRLEWFTEGLERALVVEAASSGSFRVVARAWKTKMPEEAIEATLGSEIPTGELMARLTDGIASTNELG